MNCPTIILPNAACLKAVFTAATVLGLSLATGTSWAQQSKEALPAYAKLSPAATLRLDLDGFVTRYGKNLTGAEIDAVYQHYADALAARNDNRARILSQAQLRRLTNLRQTLAAWDEARFSPADAFFGGSLERGHHLACSGANREVALEQCLGADGKRSAARRNQARERFDAFVAKRERDAAPPSEELETCASDDERNEVRARYRDWTARLRAQAKAVTVTADAWPNPKGAARIYDYARTGR